MLVCHHQPENERTILLTRFHVLRDERTEYPGSNLGGVYEPLQISNSASNTQTTAASNHLVRGRFIAFFTMSVACVLS